MVRRSLNDSPKPLLRDEQRQPLAVILHSSKMEFNIDRRLGFEEYCKIGQSLWSE